MPSQHGALGTFGALLLAPDADEVWVGAASSLGVRDKQATAAFAAEDAVEWHPFEGLLVALVAGPGQG